VVSGDDVSGAGHRDALNDGLKSALADRDLVSANAYLGAEPIANALIAGAQIVVCGRVSDPSLTVGPAMAHFGWAPDDWDRLARATMAGHLLECGAQVTGGYYADPGLKDVTGLAHLGYPIAEIDPSGQCVITKPFGSGGRVDEHIVKEQLLYEVHDPAAYVTPDVVADLSEAQVTQVGEDRVLLSGVSGHARTDSLKVNACFASGWLAEAEISYAGARAEGRARLAAQVIRERLAGAGPLRIDLIGVASVIADDSGHWLGAVPDSGGTDVRLRMALRHTERVQAERLAREMVALYTCGPAGGGGVRTSLRPTLGTLSFLMPRRLISPRFDFFDPEREGA